MNNIINYFFVFIGILILLYNIGKYYIIDKKYIKILNVFSIPKKKITIDDLKELPLVNIIIPAWKEGKIFQECLLLINKLNYPKIKVIINVGGNKETIDIANSFKKYNNFVVIYQKEGKGKINAINKCLDYVSEGIVYFIDSDIYLSNEIFFMMLYLIINKNKEIVCTSYKPIESIINIDIVKYSFIKNSTNFFKNIARNKEGYFTAHSCMKHRVIESIGKLTERKFIDDNKSISLDLYAKDYNIYMSIKLVHSFTYPNKIVKYINQNLRWIQNRQFLNMKNNKFEFFKFFLIFLFSIYLLVFPFFLFFNVYLFLFGILILFNYYLKKLRNIKFYISNNLIDSVNLDFKFFIKIVYYIFIEALIITIAFLEILFFRKNYKNRKNYNTKEIRL